MARPRGYVRKAKQWTAIGLGSAAFTGSTTTLLGSLAFTEASTVLRMIGEYMIYRTGAVVKFDSMHFGMGIGVVSSDAATVGGTAVPDPIDDPDYPWLYWAQHTLTFRGTETEPEALDGSGFVRQAFDVKSMRKLKPKESLALVVQTVDGGGAPPLSVSWGATRVLVATH